MCMCAEEGITFPAAVMSHLVKELNSSSAKEALNCYDLSPVTKILFKIAWRTFFLSNLFTGEKNLP